MRNCYQQDSCNASYMAQPGNSNGAIGCTCYLAITTVPWQYFTNSYEPDRALQAGTMFPELDKPFFGRGVRS